jgi:hypothetical protein
MTPTEFSAWQRWATPETRTQAATDAALARVDWRDRITRPGELDDLVPMCATPVVFPMLVAGWAADAALELAALVSLWPERPGDVVRSNAHRTPHKSRQRIGKV